MIYGIIGYGVVGKATHDSILKLNSVLIHDIAFNTSLNDLKSCNILFFCTPTSSINDLDQLLIDIKYIKFINPNATIIIRSTLPIGYCSKIVSEINDNILYIPEFLRERQWKIDCKNRPLIVGINSPDVPLFLAEDQCIFCSYEEAEIIKMFSNNISALRIVFANHFYDISKKTNADYNKILECYKKIEHTDQQYLDVNDELRAFGGKCLPKDLDLLINSMQQLDISQTLFSAIKTDNKKWPVTIKKF